MAIRIALAGNPNCGKTTMFNALTGANQYVGNWPGVTVEKKEGKVKSKKAKGEEVIVTDLPGIYSLSPYTLEEVVSRDYVLNENPDVIIDLVDATNIERNLYLTTQLVETGVPVVIALNMADLIEKRGMKIDTKRLSMLLGCPIVETSALKQTGLAELIDEAVKTARKKETKLPGEIFSKELEAAVSEVKNLLPEVGRDRVVYLGAEIVLQSEKTEEFNFYFSGNCIAKLYLNGKLILTCDSADMISGGGFHRSAVFAFNPGTNLAVLKIVLPENSPGEGRLLLRHSGEAAGFKLHRK